MMDNKLNNRRLQAMAMQLAMANQDQLLRRMLTCKDPSDPRCGRPAGDTPAPPPPPPDDDMGIGDGGSGNDLGDKGDEGDDDTIIIDDDLGEGNGNDLGDKGDEGDDWTIGDGGGGNDLGDKGDDEGNDKGLDLDQGDEGQEMGTDPPGPQGGVPPVVATYLTSLGPEGVKMLRRLRSLRNPTVQIASGGAMGLGGR